MEEIFSPNENPGAAENFFSGGYDDPSADYEIENESPENSTGKISSAKKKKSPLREWIEALAFAFIGVMILKTFFFEPFAIPSDSMDNTLLPGDYILVNKLVFGARLPITPISVPFSHQNIGNWRAYLPWMKIPYMRLPGTGRLQHGDVVVFNFPAEDIYPLNGYDTLNYPVDHRTHFIKRCIALPGDTLQIRDHEVYINGVHQPLPGKVMFNYDIKIETDNTDKFDFEKLGIYTVSHQGKYTIVTISLMPAQADSIAKIPEVINVESQLVIHGEYDQQIFPHSPKFPWNLDNYGPLVIPEKNATVHLTVDSLPLYERIITAYEHDTINVSNDSIFINGKYSTTYTFKMNYYFMMGDNRHYSMDSRYWGFVPEDHIVGKATMILFSYDADARKVRWDRCFKKIE